MNYEDFKEIIDNLHDEIMVYDDNYNMIYVNKAAWRHYGVTQEELIGKKFDSLDNTYWGNSTLPEVYATGEVVAKRQITNLGQDIITISVPIFDDEGNIKYVAQNVNDLYEINKINSVETKPVQVSETYDPVDKPYFGKNKKMKHNIEMIQRLKNIDSPCFIQGETGTGKSLLVKYIHNISNRRNKPLVTLNCACINQNIMESELFGYKKGAFSGASASGKKGLVEIADGGILFLDEISEMPYDLQAKLLYFIQDKKFISVGGEKEQKVDVRIIAASNRNLKQMVENGSFRADLYFRLNTFEIQIPPLRERQEDIDDYVEYYLNLFNGKYEKEHTVSNEVNRAMRKYLWPGNLREMSNIMEKLVVLSKNKEITTTDLPKTMFDLNNEYVPPSERYHGYITEDTTDDKDHKDGFVLPEKLNDAIETVEKQMIITAYQKYKSSIQVAKALGISQSKAYRLMTKYIEGYKRP